MQTIKIQIKKNLMNLDNKVNIMQSLLLGLVLMGTNLIEGCGPNLNVRKKLQVEGIFVSKLRSPTNECLGSIVIKNKFNKIDTLTDICICGSPREQIWDYLLPNDSIVKKRGDLIWYVIRGQKKEAFEYPSCYK